jgi:hypothetical protein
MLIINPVKNTKNFDLMGFGGIKGVTKRKNACSIKARTGNTGYRTCQVICRMIIIFEEDFSILL